MSSLLPIRPRLAGSLVIALGLMGISCSGGGPALGPGDQDPPLSATESHEQLGWEEIQRIPIVSGPIAHVQVTDRFVTYVRVEDSAQKPDVVMVVDLATGQSRPVYESRHPAGKIDWAEVHGSYVIFADEDRVPSVGDEGTRWELLAAHLETGRIRELARSPGSERSWPAVPQANDEGVAWTELEDPADPREGLRVRVWREGWDQPKDVVRDLTGIAAASAQFHRSGALYAAVTATDVNGQYGMDLFAVDAAGETTQVTRSGLVLDFDVQDGALAWTERPPASVGPVGAVEPYSIQLVDLENDVPPVTLAASRNNGNVVAGSVFVAWWSRNGQVRVSRQGGGAVTNLPFAPAAIAARMDASGHLLAFATTRGGAAIHVVRVAD